MPRRVIINADDFGLNREENAVIVRAFRRGLISSATLMANMPAFAQACALIHSEGLHGRVGLHVNLTYGRPLGSAIASQRCFCNASGEFELRLPRHRLWSAVKARRLQSADQPPRSSGERPCPAE